MNTDERHLLSANEAFYAAFSNHDAAAMDSLWARETEVACLHPGWPALVGREAVVESWRRILLGGDAPDTIRCRRAVARIAGDVGWVICEEVLPGGTLGATNVFVRERGGWRMVHHHAAPIASPEPEPEPERLPN